MCSELPQKCGDCGRNDHGATNIMFVKKNERR